MAKNKAYDVNAKRWNDSYGNTYHSVKVWTKDNKGNYTKVGEEKFTYGYGDQYKETARKIASKKDKSLQGDEGYTNFVRNKNNIFSVEDVRRKRDL